MRMSDDYNASVWLLLAMTYWQLGEPDKSALWYEKASEWMEQNQARHVVLVSLKKEADELFGISHTSTR